MLCYYYYYYKELYEQVRIVINLFLCVLGKCVPISASAGIDPRPLLGVRGNQQKMDVGVQFIFIHVCF